MTETQTRYEAECAAYRANVPKWRRQFSHLDECALNRMLATWMPVPPDEDTDEEDADND